MLALGAEVVATGPKGAAHDPRREFFKGLFTTALEPNEILTEIRIPVPPARSGGAYVKLERKVGDFATAGRPPSWCSTRAAPSRRWASASPTSA